MWQRFTERSRRVVFFAQEEAGRLGETVVDTTHILLGVLREADSAAATALARMNISSVEVRSALETELKPGPGGPRQDMQLSPGAKRTIDFAYDEARKLDNNYIGTEHLLLGLLRQEDRLAGGLLIKAGASYEKAFAVIARMQAEKQGEKLELSAPKLDSRRSVGDLGVVQGLEGRNYDYIEVALDAGTFIELTHVFRAKDAHGYRALLQGNQTMFLLQRGTPIKLLVSPANSNEAIDLGGCYIRVLAGDFEGYAGWINAGCFARTGPDTAPFPPPLGD